MAHPLAVYLEAKKLTHEEFARRVGIDRSMITKIISGGRKRFSVEAALRVARATHNEVSFEEALGMRRKDRRPDKAA